MAKRKTKKKTAKKAGKKKTTRKAGKRTVTRKRKPGVAGGRTMPFNEKVVLGQFAQAEDIDPDALEIRERDGFVKDYFEIAHGGGHLEWNVYRDEDAAYAEAIARVKQDLETEPEIFNQDWLQNHVDMDKVKEWVYDSKMEDDYVDEIARSDADDFWRLAENYRVSTSEWEDEDGDLPDDPDEIPDDAIDVVKEAYARDGASDAEGYIRDIYGSEAAAKMLEIGGIDIDAAAEEAVDTDGWAHFLAHYDGNYETTPSGFVYFRTN